MEIERLGKYEIIKPIGKGAAGTVWRARDPVIDRIVAIKTVKLEAHDAEAEEEIARFKREAQAAGRLSHPNIVAVYDYGEQGELAYIVMEHVDGGSLKNRLDAGERLPLPEVARVMDELLAALAHAHQKGVVHRDIKPANMMLTAAGQVKVADFGIARIESSTMTQAGTVLGTPAYMSPEQFRGEPVDARTDLYSAGVVLYQLLTGDKPFEGNLTAIMHKVLNVEPPLPSEIAGSVPAALDAVVRRAMAKRPGERFENAASFREALAAAMREGEGPDPLLGLLGGTDAEATVVARPSTARPAMTRPEPAPPPPPRRARKGLIAGLAAAGAVAAAIVAAILIIDGGSEPPPTPPGETPTTSLPQAPAEAPPRVALAPPPPQQPEARPTAPASPPPPSPPASLPPSPPPVTTPTPAAPTPASPTPATPTPTPARPPAAPPFAPPAPPAQPPPAQTQTQTQPPVPAPLPKAEQPPTPPPLPSPPIAAPTAPQPMAQPRQQTPPTPPPAPAPGTLRSTIAAALADARCSLVGGAMEGETRAKLTGYAEAGSGEAALKLRLASAGVPPGAIDWHVRGFEGPYCAALDLLRPYADRFGEQPSGLGLSLAGGKERLTLGELLTVNLTLPGYPSYLRVSYFTHDGEVVHLHPTPSDPSRAFGPGVRIALGDPASGGPRWEVGPPYGTEMIVALASERPLFPAGRPEAEQSDAYVRALADALRSGAGRVAARALMLETADH